MTARGQWSNSGGDVTDLPVEPVLIVPARLIFILGMLVGGVSLARLDPRFIDVGYLGEVRLIAILLSAFLVALAAQGWHAPVRSSRSTVIWLLAVCGLHFVTLLTWIWSVKTDFSTQQAYEITVLIAALSVAYHIFIRDPERVLRATFVAFWGLAIAFCLVGLLLSGGLSGDLAVVGAGGIGSARLLGVGVIYSFLLFFRTGNVFVLMLIPVFLLGMMLSGSRASILALACSVILLWMCRKKLAVPDAQGGRRAVMLVTLLSLLMVAVIIVLPAGREALIRFALSNITLTDGNVSASGIYLADRDTIFLTAWDGFLDNVLSGSGIGTYVGPFGEFYPHNLALNFAVDGGVLGLTGVLVVLIWPFICIIRSGDAWAIGALSAGVFFLVASMFSGTYYDARFVWIFLLLGLLCADRKIRAAGFGRLDVAFIAR